MFYGPRCSGCLHVYRQRQGRAHHRGTRTVEQFLPTLGGGISFATARGVTRKLARTVWSALAPVAVAAFSTIIKDHVFIANAKTGLITARTRTVEQYSKPRPASVPLPLGRATCGVAKGPRVPAAKDATTEGVPSISVQGGGKKKNQSMPMRMRQQKKNGGRPRLRHTLSYCRTTSSPENGGFGQP